MVVDEGLLDAASRSVEVCVMVLLDPREKPSSINYLLLTPSQGLTAEFLGVVVADVESMGRTGFRPRRARQHLNWLMDTVKMCQAAATLAPFMAAKLAIRALEVSIWWGV